MLIQDNLQIKDEFTLVTDLSHHLAQRYTRPDSSIMIKVDHSACLALGGTFDPCYILIITALPSQMGPTINKRNAALIQAFMADILSVSSDRGIIKFEAIEEGNYAMNGTTMLGEIERLEKSHSEESGGMGGVVKRAVTGATRKSTPVFASGKKSMPELESDRKASMTNGLSTPGAVTPTPVERKRRSTTAAASPGDNMAPQLFELSATENERPATSGGAYAPPAAENGLRMNGISKEDLLASANALPNGRPKTFAGHSPLSHSPVQNRSADESMPLAPQRQPSQNRRTSSYQKPTQAEATMTQVPNLPSSPPLIKPAPVIDRRISSSHTPITSQQQPLTTTTTTKSFTDSTRPPQPNRDTYLSDPLPTTTNPTPPPKTTSPPSPRPKTSSPTPLTPSTSARSAASKPSIPRSSTGASIVHLV